MQPSWVFREITPMTTSLSIPRGMALVVAALALPAAAAAQHPDHAEHGTDLPGIPASLRAEHQEIHERLDAATRLPGATGVAARALAAVLHPHFVREEQIALPPLGLLAPLSRGEFSPATRDILPLADSLRSELPRMLEEHEAIRAATAHLSETARAEKRADAAALAEALALHATSEEELFYPAAILVGDLIRGHP